MKLKRAGLGFILAVFCLCFSASAEMPRQFYFEDTCADSNGVPYNGYHNLQLQLYSSISGGSNLYEDANSEYFTNGLCVATIGDNPVSGSLTNALACGEVYVQVVVDGDALSPREPLIPVPYALNAASVASNAVTSAMIAKGAISTNKLAADVDDRYVNISGDTMTGPLSMDQNSLDNVIGISGFGSTISFEERMTYQTNLWGNWNADMLDGRHGSEFVNKSGANVITGSLTVANGPDNTIQIGVDDGITIGDNHISNEGIFYLEGTSIWQDKIRFSGANDSGQIIMGNETNIIVGTRQLLGNWEVNSNLTVGGTLFGDGSGLSNLPGTGLTTNAADARYINAAGDTMAGVLNLGLQNMTNVVGIYGPLSGPASNLTIMAGSRPAGGGYGGTLYLSGGWNGVSGYGNVEVRAPLLTAEIRGASQGPAGDLLVRAATGFNPTFTGGVLRLAGGAAPNVGTSGWIRVESRVDANGQTISNALFVGDGSGLTNLPVTGLTTNAADARYINAAEDTMTGPLILQNNGTGPALSLYSSYIIYDGDDAIDFGSKRFYGDWAVDSLTTGTIGMDGNGQLYFGSGTVEFVGDLFCDGLGNSFLFDSDTGKLSLGYDLSVGGKATIGYATYQTNLTVAGWAKIDYIPPQGGILMGVYTNR